MLANRDRAASRKSLSEPRPFASSVAWVHKSAGHEKDIVRGGEERGRE